MWIGSLPFYDFEGIKESTDALWTELAKGLEWCGYTPVQTERYVGPSTREIWFQSGFLLTQSCGYDLFHWLH